MSLGIITLADLEAHTGENVDLDEFSATILRAMKDGGFPSYPADRASSHYTTVVSKNEPVIYVPADTFSS